MLISQGLIFFYICYISASCYKYVLLEDLTTFHVLIIVFFLLIDNDTVFLLYQKSFIKMCLWIIICNKFDELYCM